MQGSDGNGIILTTGTLTAETRREAVRDGAPPIDFVDGEKLIEMFAMLEFGLKPRAAFDIDDNFLEDFPKRISGRRTSQLGTDGAAHLC